jgi:hypothetical protein
VTNYLLNGNFPPKQGDPGIQTISCATGKTDFHNAVSDLGA